MLSKYYDDACVSVKMLLMNRWQPEKPDTLKQKIVSSHSQLSAPFRLTFFSLFLVFQRHFSVAKALRLAQQGWEKMANAG